MFVTISVFNLVSHSELVDLIILQRRFPWRPSQNKPQALSQSPFEVVTEESWA